MIKPKPQKTLLASSIIAANLLAGAAVPAFAQEAEDGLLEEVTVTASFRGSLIQALDAKRDATGAVDSFMAEDIADFPDTNLAESMQRVPGVTITREAGEGREITVRGLDATFTRVMINNAMGQSLSAGSGGVRTSRAFDFNVFASELINRIDVHKSQSAELEEGSLGATVDLHTGRPFDYEPVTIALNMQGACNDQSQETKPRGSGLFSFSNEDQTIGALISVASAERYVSNTGADTGRWEDDTYDFADMESPSLSYGFDTTDPANWEVPEFRAGTPKFSPPQDWSAGDPTHLHAERTGRGVASLVHTQWRRNRQLHLYLGHGGRKSGLRRYG